MRSIYLIARLFPFIGLCLTVVFVEMGRHFRRRHQDYQYYCWFWAAAFLLLTLLWFIFRGDIYSDDWVRTFLGG